MVRLGSLIINRKRKADTTLRTNKLVRNQKGKNGRSHKKQTQTFIKRMHARTVIISERST